jgi:proline iminopeptidase
MKISLERRERAMAQEYLDSSGRSDRLAGGSRMIPVETPSGTFRVWTKRVGNNPRMKLLLLHGGPGSSHEYLEAFDGFLPAAGIEYYYYDQLGSARSDQPEDDDLWRLPRFVDELEQVRQALGLDADNFYLYGHSWGGMLGIEYALQHQRHLKGLIVSNMMASVPAYNEYARKLTAELDPDVLAELEELDRRGDPTDPRYRELLLPNHYAKHVLRMEDTPEPVVRGGRGTNRHIYVLMQGPSELGARGRIEHWDRTADLKRITVPTLVIGATHDTMEPEHMRWMAGQVADGRYLHCPDGSHMAMYDDQEAYMAGLIAFIHDVDRRPL